MFRQSILAGFPDSMQYPLRLSPHSGAFIGTPVLFQVFCLLYRGTNPTKLADFCASTNSTAERVNTSTLPTQLQVARRVRVLVSCFGLVCVHISFVSACRKSLTGLFPPHCWNDSLFRKPFVEVASRNCGIQGFVYVYEKLYGFAS